MHRHLVPCPADRFFAEQAPFQHNGFLQHTGPGSSHIRQKNPAQLRKSLRQIFFRAKFPADSFTADPPLQHLLFMHQHRRKTHVPCHQPADSIHKICRITQAGQNRMRHYGADFFMSVIIRITIRRYPSHFRSPFGHIMQQKRPAQRQITRSVVHSR